VSRLVDSMLALGLTYSPAIEDDPEAEDEAGSAAPSAVAGGRGGAHAEPPLQFVPPVHRLLAYPRGAQPRRGLSMATRQMLARQIEMEGIRRAEAGRMQSEGGAAAGTSDGHGAAAGTTNKAAAPVSQPTFVPLSIAERMQGGRGAMTASAAAAKKGTWLEAMARGKQQRRAAARAAVATAGAGVIVDGDGMPCDGGGAVVRAVLYKFNEGYTNAVRRPVLVSELLA
jgi:chromosome transmission fidelity protein 18